MKKQIIIGLCDDDKTVHHLVGQMIKEYEKSMECKTVFVPFSSAEELLDYTGELDMLLLDIDMPQMDGIEAGHKLRQRGISWRIVMLTGKTERFKETYKIEAFRFVSKPVEEQELFEAIDAVQSRMIGQEQMSLSIEGIMHTVRQKDILYVMADGSQTRIFLEHASCRSEKPLKWWEKELDKRMFFRTHRSYIVNLGKILSVDKDIIVLDSGEKIQLAKRSKSVFKKVYMEYDIRYR